MSKGCIKGLAVGCSSIVILLIIFSILFISTIDFQFPTSPTKTNEYTIEIDSLNNNVIVSKFKWNFRSSNLTNKRFELTMQLLEEDVKIAMRYVDRIANMSYSELGVDPRYERVDPVLHARVVWDEIYRKIYNQGFPNFEKIMKGFQSVFTKEKMSNRDKTYFVISFVQSIKYERPGGVLDILPPLGSLAERYGDCDTKAILLYILLEKMGVDCVMFWSYEYKHAMLGVALGSSGVYKTYKGKDFYFVETTYPDWRIGEISPEIDNLKYWYLDDLDLNRNEINYEIELPEDEPKEDSPTNRNKPQPATK